MWSQNVHLKCFFKKNGGLVSTRARFFLSINLDFPNHWMEKCSEFRPLSIPTLHLRVNYQCSRSPANQDCLEHGMCLSCCAVHFAPLPEYSFPWSCFGQCLGHNCPDSRTLPQHQSQVILNTNNDSFRYLGTKLRLSWRLWK